MLDIYRNLDFTGLPFSFLTDAYSIVQLPNTADGQTVLQITEYTHATNPLDTTFNKPELKAVITGTNLNWSASPNGAYASLGQTINFTSGTISSILVNDYVGSTLSTLGTPRNVYALTGGDIDASYLNQSPSQVDIALTTLQNDSGSNITGTSGNDVLNGTTTDDSIYGLAGNDVLFGGAGADELFGGSGNDLLRASLDGDHMDGGSGTDIVSYLGSNAGVNADIRIGTEGTGGYAAGDTYVGVENITGSNYSDVLSGNIFANRLIGRNGDDTLNGFRGNDSLFGGNGEDELFGGSGNDLLDGGNGNDYLSGGTGNDTMNGRSGNDIMEGDAGNDHLLGWFGEDVLFGGAGDDLVDGGAGNDYVEGNDGNDTLLGRGGNDVLVGGAGDDFFAAGVGDDGIFMGSGADTFLVTPTFEAGGVQYGNGHDTIFDFEVGIDTVLFEAGSMTLADVLAGLSDTAAGCLIEYSWVVGGVTYEQSLLLEGVFGDDLDVNRDFVFE